MCRLLVPVMFNNLDIVRLQSVDGGEEMNSLSSNCCSEEFQLFSPLRRISQIKAATEGLDVLILVLRNTPPILGSLSLPCEWTTNCPS